MFENHVMVTEKVRVCLKRWPGGACGQVATPRSDSENAECDVILLRNSG